MDDQQKKILIIDDDDRNIFALKAVLTANKFNCVVANGSFPAVDLLKADNIFAVALVDMMMPGMDGYELMAAIQEMPSLKEVKLVAVTAQAMVGDKEKCLAAGADAYISKPVNVDTLVGLLQRYLKQQP